LIAGMQVIGVAGSDAKCRAVRELGAHHAINYRTGNVAPTVREATDGRGVDLILDPVGGDGFGHNFAMLAPLGLVVSYGGLAGPPNPNFVAAMRQHHGISPAVRFFTIHSFDDWPDIRAHATRTLLDHLSAGRIAPLIYARLQLAEAGRAQAMLEAGEVIGKVLLKP
jgi:NADPH:quinone reductase